MKFIHCADLHLSSPLTANLPPKKAERIHAGIFYALESLIDKAKKSSISLIVIAGDLFDTTNINPSVLHRFKLLVSANPDITFLFVYGNHDYTNDNPFADFSQNFKVLSSGESLLIEDTFFWAYSNALPSLPIDSFNVVIAHGDVNGEINLPSLKNKNIDYLALGHIHGARLEKLDERGVWAYSGCLVGRGWDELGEKGYYLVDTTTKTYAFTPIGAITFNEIVKDITPYSTILEFENAFMLETNAYDQNSALRLVITGEITDENFIDFSYLQTMLSEKFFYFELKDKTRISFDNLLGESVSLKGEFLKVIKQKGYTEEVEKQIIETGLKYLK